MTIKLVQEVTFFALYINNQQKAQLPSNYITLGTVGNEGCRIGAGSGPSQIVASYKNFRVWDHVMV